MMKNEKNCCIIIADKLKKISVVKKPPQNGNTFPKTEKG